MQRQRVCALLGIAFSVLPVGVLHGQRGPQPEIRVETLYPRHAPPGRTTVINVAVPSADTVQAAEVSPPGGITVSGIKGVHSGSEQNIGWWEITLDVAKEAAPGDRGLVLMMQRGARTAPAMISVPTHAPAISNLRITPPPPNQSNADVQLAVTDTAGDLGASPYVWFTADCGDEPIVGALRSTVSAGIVRAALPKPAGKCDLQVRITDAAGIESNTLKTTVEFTK